MALPVSIAPTWDDSVSMVPAKAALLALAALSSASVDGDYCALLQDGQSGTRKGCAASVRQQSRQRLRNSG